MRFVETCRSKGIVSGPISVVLFLLSVALMFEVKLHLFQGHRTIRLDDRSFVVKACH